MLEISLKGHVGDAGVFVGAEMITEGELFVPLALADRVDVDVDVRAIEEVAKEIAEFAS
jgi:hypothetical protein